MKNAYDDYVGCLVSYKSNTKSLYLISGIENCDGIKPRFVLYCVASGLGYSSPCGHVVIDTNVIWHTRPKATG